MKRFFAALLAAMMLLCLLTACGGKEKKESAGGDTKAVAGDYYLDLSQLGMKLTIYLRISEDGRFLFSNTTQFTLCKSSGTVEQGSGKYIMVYDSVNGEDKNLSEGITSSFQVKEDGSLDFSGCERIFYGSATAITVSQDDPAVILTGVPLPDDYQEASTDTAFQAGVYTGQDGEGRYVLSFFEDSSYLLTMITGNGTVYASESGIYGVSTTQLALTPTGLSRQSGEVLSETELMVPVLTGQGKERKHVSFTLQTEAPQAVTFTGTTEDGKTASLTVSDFGIFTTEAEGFRESGILVLDSAASSFKIYPDHPQTGVRGLNQIGTVPSGSFAMEDGKLTLTDFRFRASESLSRSKCTFIQN